MAGLVFVATWFRLNSPPQQEAPLSTGLPTRDFPAFAAQSQWRWYTLKVVLLMAAAILTWCAWKLRLPGLMWKRFFRSQCQQPTLTITHCVINVRNTMQYQFSNTTPVEQVVHHLSRVPLDAGTWPAKFD